MIVLKDIKVSKVRIPVQNALWLRPIDKDTYKIYYPSGGNWKEVILEASEDMDSTIEKRVEALEEGLKAVNVDISQITLDLESLDARIGRVSSVLQANINILAGRVSSLESTVIAILGMLESQVTLIRLPDSFDTAANSGVEYTRDQMANFGITELVFRSIYDGYCRTAIILGETYSITYNRGEDDAPGYGGIICFNGIVITDPDTGVESYTQYKITPEITEDSVSGEPVWIYTITRELIEDEQPVPDDPEPEEPEPEPTQEEE